MKKPSQSQPEAIDEQETEAIIERMGHDELSKQDRKVIAKVLRSYLYLANMVQEDGARLSNIRAFLLGKKAKKTNPNLEVLTPEDSSKDKQPSAYDSDMARPLTTSPDKETRKKKSKSNTQKPGHGRLSADDYTGARHSDCPHVEHQVGDICPKCGKGKLYRDKPKKQILLHGHAPVSATCWHVEVLRCASCKAVFNARQATGKYDVSVKTSIALSRYYLGLPFHRLEGFQKMLGVPLPDATQWHLTEQLFDDVFPVFVKLIEISAQSSLIHHDDTGACILSLEKENKTLAKGARYGTHSTGFVTVGEHTIILFFTGRTHAGENLDKLLDHREAGLDKPTQMCDAASVNSPKRHQGETIICHCNAHAVRKFKDIRESFPDPCATILGTMSQVFDYDRHTKTEGMNDDQRQLYHAVHSGPLLEDLQTWMLEQQNEKREVEPNSALGQAMNYMLKRWKLFTRFLHMPGVPLDNNIVERALKRLIFQRKNSFFYATEYSAYVGCALTSLIMTSVEAGINVFEYLNVLQSNNFAVARAPEDWLPWNYQQQLESPVITTPVSSPQPKPPDPDRHSTTVSEALAA